MIYHLDIRAPRQGLHEITDELQRTVAQSGVNAGLCSILVQHTSASLLIQENADPTARKDLEAWLNRLVKEDDPMYTHVLEGPDDMPSHIKSALTATTLSIPIDRGRLALGTWQGVYLWEHRREPSTRHLVIHITN